MIAGKLEKFWTTPVHIMIHVHKVIFIPEIKLIGLKFNTAKISMSHIPQQTISSKKETF